jgi:hypothetical protein
MLADQLAGGDPVMGRDALEIDAEITAVDDRDPP